LSNSRRKVKKYVLKVVDNKSGNAMDGNAMANVFEAAFAVPEQKRILDNPSNNRFYILDSVMKDKTFLAGYFTSAKYNHRPDLICKTDLKRRPNPKLMEEGECERTHFGLLPLKKEAALVLETKAGGISLGPLLRYFQRYTLEGSHLECDLFASTTFMAKLEKLVRATSINVFSSRDIIHPTFGMSRPMPDMQDTIMITFKAKKLGSIKRHGAKMYGWLSKKAGPEVTRIRVIGKTEDKDDVVIDSDKLADFEYVQVDIDGNGQVVTNSFIPKLKAVLQSMM
jgi:hypothetical protein